MADIHEQSICIKFCFKLGWTQDETCRAICHAFGDKALHSDQCSEIYRKFEKNYKIEKFIPEDLCRTIDDICDKFEALNTDGQTILTDDLNIASKPIPKLLTPEQKKDRLLTLEQKKDRLLTSEQKKDRLLTPEQKKDRLLTPEQKRDRLLTPEQKKDRLLTPEQKKDRLLTPEQKKDRLLTPEQKKDSLLTPEEKQNQKRLDVCHHLRACANDDPTFISRVITGDEIWVHLPDSDIMQQSKITLIVFFDIEGIVHQEFVPLNQIINADFYCDVLKRLKEAVCNKRRYKCNWLLHHDNARTHTAQKTLNFLRDNNISVVPHPPNSPDLAPCDFFLFPKIKKELNKHSKTRDKVEAVWQEVLCSLQPEDFQEAFEEWQKRWDQCIKSKGDYFK